jgi:tetratricopeptide (TPR) repeat protein
LSTLGFSQSSLTDLKFETEYYNAVDQWVAFPKVDEESTYDFGYIFLDVHKGFAYKYESKFIAEGKTIRQVENDTTVGFVKFILDENTKKVSVLNKAQVKALNLPERPNWLETYKKGANQPRFLVKTGFYFNSVGASVLALPYLQEAYKEDTDFPGLAYELGYALNAVEDYQSAIEVLKQASDKDPTNWSLYKELGYSYEQLDRIEEAENMYKLGVSLSDNKDFKVSLSLRMVQHFYNSKNKSKFQEWSNKLLSFSENNPQYQNYINSLTSSWDREN